MTSSTETKVDLGRRVDELTRQDSLAERMPVWLGDRLDSRGPWQSQIIQLDRTGAATVKLAGGSEVVFAKLYHDGNGRAIYDKLVQLRADGFGPDQRYQAVEPLAFVPEYDMLLARAARGRAVSEHIGVDEDALLSGVEEAARWLARLHGAPLRIGRPHSLLVSGELLSLCRRLAKTVKARPEHLDRAKEMVRVLETLAEDTVEGTLVQSHGQYRPIHVFIEDGTVTVIDLDRSRPCDPARDVAEFLHRLRMTSFSRAASPRVADAATRAFLAAYASEAADARFLANLRFHWARYVFHSLNRKLKDCDDQEASELVTRYRAEFDDAVSGRHSAGLVDG